MRAPLLEETIDRLLARERRRRRDASLRRSLGAVALVAIALALWRVRDRYTAREPFPLDASLAILGFVALAGVFLVLRAATCRSDVQMARELDLRLSLDDRASAALALVRGATTSRLEAFVLADADAALAAAAGRVDAAFPSKPQARVTATTRRLWIAALVAAALAALVELKGGWWGLLPTLAPGAGGSIPFPTKTTDAPRADPKDDGTKTAEPTAVPKPPERDAETKPPTPPKQDGDVRVAMRTSREEYDADEPVPTIVSAVPEGALDGARRFELRIAVDEEEFGTGLAMRVDPAREGGDAAAFDLRRLPGLDLKPGEHVAHARLVTRTSREEHVSPPVKFRVRDPKKDPKNEGAGGKPKPKPSPQGAPQPEPPKKDDASPSPPPAPPAALEKKVVVPLFGQGEEVKKRGLTLVLDPGGGTETPPTRRPLAAALPGAKRRAEEAVDTGAVREEDRELVRRYFELLEALGR